MKQAEPPIGCALIICIAIFVTLFCMWKDIKPF